MKFDNKKTIIIVSILFLVIVLLVSLLFSTNVKEGLTDTSGNGLTDTSGNAVNTDTSGNAVNTIPNTSSNPLIAIPVKIAIPPSIGNAVNTDTSGNAVNKIPNTSSNPLIAIPVKIAIPPSIPKNMSICTGNAKDWPKSSNYSKYSEELKKYAEKAQKESSSDWFLTDVNGYDPTKHKKDDYIWQCNRNGESDRPPNSYYSNGTKCPYKLLQRDGACYNPPSKTKNYPNSCSGYDDTQKSWYYGWTDPTKGILYSCVAKDVTKYRPTNNVCPGNLKNKNGVCEA
jgi:hypothetical protein